METATSKNAAINSALLSIQSKMGKVKKGASNPFFKSTYADLNACLELVKPLLEEHGCYLIQPIMADVRSGKNVVVTRITHAESNENIESSVFLPENTDPQKDGSSITYYRRYTLKSLLGMQDADDDGNLAAGKRTSKAKVTKGDF